MSSTVTRRMPPARGRTFSQRVEIQQFARRLAELMGEAGFSQSDLAREVWGTIKDKRGYDVARNRDRISSYLAGKSYPDPQNLHMIAKALGTTAEELAPDVAVATVERELPELAMTMAHGHPNMVHLHVNKLLPLASATEIIGIINRTANE